MGLKQGATWNTLGEPIENLKGEHIGNKGKMKKNLPPPPASKT
jgi:hypothetical protein